MRKDLPILRAQCQPQEQLLEKIVLQRDFCENISICNTHLVLSTQEIVATKQQVDFNKSATPSVHRGKIVAGALNENESK